MDTAQTPRLLRILTALGISAFVVVLYMTLVYAGTDSIQGHVQRIFYPHLASFAGATLSFLVAGTGGILYLLTRQIRWDSLSVASVEVGILLMVITLLTGMVWSRPTWNTWWTEDPRLIATLITVLSYGAYLLFRNGILEPGARRTFASVYSLAGLLPVLYTAVIVRLRSDTIHPVVLGSSPQNAQAGIEMAPSMRVALLVVLLMYVLFITPSLIWWRVRLQAVFERIEDLQHKPGNIGLEGIPYG